MSRASTSCSPSAFGSAPETSASPPVLAKGTASEVRMATRIFERRERENGSQKERDEYRSSIHPSNIHPTDGLALHRRQQFGVRLGLLQTLEHDFHLLDGRERIQHASHHPDAIEIFLADEQLFLAGSRTLQIDGGEQPLVAQTA